LTKQTTEPIIIPANHPCATFFVDESTAKESAGSFFVVGAVKLRKPGTLLREIQTIRNDLGYDKEFKWSTITAGRLTAYFRLIDALWESDARIAASVVELSSNGNPFSGNQPEWKAHARIAAQLLIGNLNNHELGTVWLDERSTPAGVAFDEVVRNMVNQKFGSLGLVSVVCADSNCCDGLQLADLVAGAVAHQRRAQKGKVTHKSKVAARIATVFEVPDFGQDQRTDRVNVMTVKSSGNGRQPSQTRKPGRGPVVEMLRKAL